MAYTGTVVAVSVANITISNPNITTLDGVTLVSGTSRILLAGQTTTSQNGVWIFQGKNTRSPLGLVEA
jgi:hypothetical protein